MTKLSGTVALFGALILLPSIARSQYAESASSTDASAAVVVDPTPPSTPPPTAQPVVPPPGSPPAPPAQVQGQSLPPGQWVHTQQYGWIWMPYSDGYTYIPPDGYGEPYAYVYYPLYGWAWLATPWVWGFGPWPYFGSYGPARYGWYGHGWWRHPSRWSYVPARSGPIRPAPAYRGSAGHGSVRPEPFRGGAERRGGGYMSRPGGQGSPGYGGSGARGGGAGGRGRDGRR